jgi:hypothetical protein
MSEEYDNTKINQMPEEYHRNYDTTEITLMPEDYHRNYAKFSSQSTQFKP